MICLSEKIAYCLSFCCYTSYLSASSSASRYLCRFCSYLFCRAVRKIEKETLCWAFCLSMLSTLVVLLEPAYTHAVKPKQNVSSESTDIDKGKEVLRLGITTSNLEEKSLDNLRSQIQNVELSNGLRVVFVRREVAPIFTGQVWVKVGGVDELPGKTGVSHMLEHMAFKGTKTIGTKSFLVEKPLLDLNEKLLYQAERQFKEEGAISDSLKAELADVDSKLKDLWLDNEFSSIYEKAGASGLNAATSKDFTLYTVNLPIAAFELWCAMESDRIINPVYRQFYKERDVVLEERRMRVEDSPSGLLYEHLLATSYLSHPYRLPVIGWPTDIKSLRLSDISEIHTKYYRPDNVVLSIVGDLQLEQITPILEKYFGRIQRSKYLPAAQITQESEQLGSRDVFVDYDAQAAVMIAYHKPSYPNPDDSYFAILHSVLSQGRSSVLHKELVQADKIASSVETFEAPGSLFPSLFVVGAFPVKGIKSEILRDRVQQILDRYRTQEVDAKLLEESKKRVLVGFLSGLSSSEGLAEMLGQSELLWGDWSAAFNAYNSMQATTAQDVKRLFASYLTIKNRTSVFIQK